MGLPGIFKLLRELGFTVDFLKEMRGKVVGIDLYTWLHKDLVGLGHGPGNDQMEEVVKCTLARARRLAQAGIQAVFCVEGDLLPGKADTAEGRTHIRAAAMEELLPLYEEGTSIIGHPRGHADAKVISQIIYITHQIGH